MLVFWHTVANAKRFCLNQSSGLFCRLLWWKQRQMNIPGYSCPAQSLAESPFKGRCIRVECLMKGKTLSQPKFSRSPSKGVSSTLPEPCVLHTARKFINRCWLLVIGTANILVEISLQQPTKVSVQIKGMGKHVKWIDNSNDTRRALSCPVFMTHAHYLLHSGMAKLHEQ